MATPDWLANIQNGAWQSQNPANAQQMYLDPTTNKWVMPLMRGAQEGFNTDPGQAAQATVSGYRQYDNLGKDANSKDYNGHQYVDYDTAGTQNGGGTFSWMGDSSMQDLMKGALVMAGTYGLGTALAGAGGAMGGASGAGAGAGGGVSGFGDAGLMYGGTGAETAAGSGLGGIGGSGSGVGFSFGVNPTAAEIASGVHIPGSALSAGAGAAGGAMGASGAGGAAPAAAGGANGPLLSKAALDGTTAFGANSVPGAYQLAGGGLSGLLGGLGGSGLGTLATVAGGLLGAQGNKAENTSTKTMDPRLDGPVFGQDGIVPRSQALLAQQMSPEAQKQWLDMQAKGQGLLGGSIAGNGFNRYYK